MIKNCFIWTRVSTKHQEDNGGSLDYQKQLCREYASRNGYVIKGEYGGKHESAKTPGKLIKEMISAVKKDKTITHILVSEVDRFSRNAAQALSIIDNLKALGVYILSIKQGIDSSTSHGKMMLGILLCTAEWDNANRVDKFLSGRKNCMKSGVWCSRAPMGYYKSGKSINTIYTINKTGELLRKAFYWKLQGISNKEIVSRLEALGVKMSKQTLHKILTNPFYAGKIKNHLIGDEIVDGRQPALITYSQFLRVQEILSGRTGRYKHKKENPKFPLRHHVLCSRDYTPLTAYTNKKKHIDYYKCNVKGCSQNTSAKVLHRKYKELLEGYNVISEIHDLFKKVVMAQLGVMESDNEKDKTLLKKRLTEIEGDIKSIQIRHAVGKISDEEYDVAISELSEERAKLKENLDKLGSNLSNLQKKVWDVIAICSDLSTLWAEGDLETCRRVQNLVFPDGILWNKSQNEYLTIKENSVFSIFHKISKSYGKAEGTALNEAVPLCG